VPRFRPVLLIGLAVFGGIALLAAGNAGATPLIAAQAGLSCGACHVNPDGGMLRTAAGESYGVNTLPLYPGLGAPLDKGLSLLKENPLLTVGGDFRLMGIAYTGQTDHKSPFFFPMQGDVYVGSRLSQHTALLTQFGLQRGGNPVFREVFGMVDALPLDGYVKFGKFLPPFGHRLEDHTAYIRKDLFVDQSNPVSYGSGVEVGFNPAPIYGRFAYTNDDLTPGLATGSVSNLYSGVLGFQNSWLQVGGSFLQAHHNANWGFADTLPADTTGKRRAYGGYGSVHLWQLTGLFEYDLVKNDPDGGKDFDEFISFAELDFQAAAGTFLKVRYETLDPNRDIKDDEWSRTTAGIEFHPQPFTEIDLQYRYNDTPAEKYSQVLLMVHFWI
jgi:hypothetical protein